MSLKDLPTEENHDLAALSEARSGTLLPSPLQAHGRSYSVSSLTFHRNGSGNAMATARAIQAIS